MVYLNDCSVCHGLPGQPKSPIAEGEFPDPPQLFVAKDMVTDDPEGETYWKVTHGIRLSGMPGFANTLSDTQRWQVTMLVAHADKIPAGAKSLVDAPSGPGK
jgi:thiosulfate dehydrogenase